MNRLLRALPTLAAAAMAPLMSGCFEFLPIIIGSQMDTPGSQNDIWSDWDGNGGYVGEQPVRMEVGERMAVLVNDMDGARVDVIALDGSTQQSFDVELDWAASLAIDSAGDFLVTIEDRIHRVSSNDGRLGTFTANTFNTLWQIHASATDEVITVAHEFDASEVDERGDVVSHAYTAEHCWMDATVGPNPEGDMALFDVFGPGVATWDAASGQFAPLIVGLPYDTRAIGRDGNGNYYAGGYSGSVTVVPADGSAMTQVRIPDAYEVLSVEAASEDSVFVLYNHESGYGLAEIDVNAGVENVFSQNSSYGAVDLVTW